MATAIKNNGLKNPAAIAAASESAAGQKAIEAGVSTISTVIKVALVGAVLYGGYLWWKSRFQPIGIATNRPPAQITEGQAQTKANALYQAMLGPGTDFDTVRNNLIGLNYNDWVLVYNAFGKRSGILPLSAAEDLSEWLVNDLSSSELEELRYYLGPGLF